jgi:diamine N-acetyltransferase
MAQARVSREVINDVLSRTDAPSVRLRRAGVDDAARLAAIGSRLFVEAHDGLVHPSDIATYLSEAFSESLQLSELMEPESAMWIAETLEGESAGLALLRRSALPLPEESRECFEVAHLFADRKSHGHRVTATLLATCVSEARAWGGDVLWLGVWDRMPRAIAFYQRLGLRVVGARDVVLGSDRQRELLLALTLR